MKTRFRILHCLRAPVGGLFRHVCDLAIAQQARGHQVGVVCADDGNELTARRLTALEPHLELGLHRLSMRREVGLADVLAARAVLATARGIGVDILHGHGAKGGAYARLASRTLAGSPAPVRCFYTPHGGSLHYGPDTLKGRLFTLAERQLARFTDGLIFESAYSAARYAAQIGPTAAPQRIIPNGVLEAEFAPVHYNDDAAELLFVGELRILKGVDVLLAALAEVHCLDQTGTPRLVVVGDGPDAAAFREQAEAFGLSAAVTFPGALPARRAFEMGHHLIVPSRAESFPYIVLEAGAAGLPMLASDVGGIPEIVGDTGNRLLPPGDPAALAAAIQAMLAHRGETAARAHRLQQRIAGRFTVDAMTDAVVDFYAHAGSARIAA